MPEAKEMTQTENSVTLAGKRVIPFDSSVVALDDPNLEPASLNHTTTLSSVINSEKKLVINGSLPTPSTQEGSPTLCSWKVDGGAEKVSVSVLLETNTRSTL
jgi:hypothetical protein